MTNGELRGRPAVGSDEAPATVAIHLNGRREALDLMAALTAFHSFLVEHTRERWVVHARAPGFRGESPDELLATIERWKSEIESSEHTDIRRDRVSRVQAR